MFRNIAFAVIYVAVLVFLTAALARSADYGTAEEARATLDKAVAAVKADKAKALDMFNKGEGGFKDRDLYVFCANALDGVITAHPTHKGEQLADIKGKKGFPLGQEMMKNATEGKVNEVPQFESPPSTQSPSSAQAGRMAGVRRHKWSDPAVRIGTFPRRVVTARLSVADRVLDQFPADGAEEKLFILQSSAEWGEAPRG